MLDQNPSYELGTKLRPRRGCTDRIGRCFYILAVQAPLPRQHEFRRPFRQACLDRLTVLGHVMAVWMAMAAAAHAAVSLTGVVRDTSGAPVADAQVVVLTAERTSIATTRTDAQGRFTLQVPSPGRYLLIASAPSLGESRTAVTAAGGEPLPIEIVLHIGPLREEVTVTATPSLVDDLLRVGQPVTVVPKDEIAARVHTVVAQAVEGETGVHLQRTSPTMAGVFVRGLTGNKVNVFVDGVRYSNGAQRGGVNTFLDLIEPDALETIEVVRGPSSVQYGSDALGGSVQFLSRPPVLGSAGNPRWGGSFGVSAGTAHRYGSGQGFVAYMAPALGLTGAFSGRGVGRMRPGGGVDSHAAVTRFFGIPSTAVMDERLPDTGFSQYGGSVRGHWAPSTATRIVTSYVRTNQDGGKRYDQLLGGDGNLIAGLNDLSLDLFSARFERLSLGMFDHAALTYSVNSQREERVNQGGNGNPAATIGHEPERTTAHGMHGTATSQVSPRQTLTIGGDVYFERLTSKSFDVNAITDAVSARRPRVPDAARFTQGGAFVQTTFDARPERVRLIGALRVGGSHYRARASDSPLINGRPLWPDDALSTSSVTFRTAAVLTPSNPWAVSLSLSRGFRSPHMTDLGTLGLTGSGFEVAAPDVAGLGGFVGTTADGSAVSSGEPVAQVKPETSLQYEASIRYRRAGWRTELGAFVNAVHDNIQKQALILPPGAVGLMIGGQPITTQAPSGAVFVAASTSPVLVRANFDNARIWGIEHTAQASFGRNLTLHTAFTYLRARDTGTDLPPNIEGGTPAPDGFVTLRWAPSASWWVEPYAHLAWRQTHLSSLDLGDRRTGATRSRTNIRAFFLNGARVRGWIGAGGDAAFGSADDLLLATGETLAQIQDRVLGEGVSSAPLFVDIPGYGTFGVRAGIRRGAHEILIDAENLNDKNYRGVSWGMDAPGRGVSARYLVRF
jgi:hemoglobin/transferrin/lactoferrin receptor protein